MNTISKAILIVFCAAGLSPAASILSVRSPAGAAVGSYLDADVVITPGADSITGYQVDLLFPAFLSPQSLTARGYFAANGVFDISSDLIDPTAASVTAITQVLAGSDQLPAGGTTADYTLFSIRFLVTGVGTGSIGIDPGTALLFGPLDFGGLPSSVDFSTVDAPVASAPEPASLPLCVCALVATLTLRRRWK